MEGGKEEGGRERLEGGREGERNRGGREGRREGERNVGRDGGREKLTLTFFLSILKFSYSGASRLDATLYVVWTEINRAIDNPNHAGGIAQFSLVQYSRVH